MKNSEDLRRALRAIDHKSLSCLQGLKRKLFLRQLYVSVTHVRIPLPLRPTTDITVDGKTAGFHYAGLYDTRYKRVALRTTQGRLFARIEIMPSRPKAPAKAG